ncbi:hypothetical protein EB001_21840, partial [bacterium]|nr:hypothetical protein [bacterium]
MIDSELEAEPILSTVNEPFTISDPPNVNPELVAIIAFRSKGFTDSSADILDSNIVLVATSDDVVDASSL